MKTFDTEPYDRILLEGPNEAAVGTGLISLVHVEPGAERNYNSWYDDDHYYSGVLSLPWTLGGARWIATRELRALRYPADSSVTDDLDRGAFLNTYLGAAGRFDEFVYAAGIAYDRLHRQHRMNQDGKRSQVYTGMQEFVGSVLRDDLVPLPIHAFAYPYRWSALEVIEAPSNATRVDLEEWLVDTHLSEVIGGTSAAMALVFRPRPDVDRAHPGMDTSRFANRLSVLWLLEADPAQTWEQLLAHEGERIEATGLGRVEFMSGFRRLLAGTHTHLDEL